LDLKDPSLSKRNSLHINIKNQNENIVEELEPVGRFRTEIQYSMCVETKHVPGPKHDVFEA
jgi:hypothetical protein